MRVRILGDEMKKTKDSSEMWRELIEIVRNDDVPAAIWLFCGRKYSPEIKRLYALALTVAQVSMGATNTRLSSPLACCFLSEMEDGESCQNCLLRKGRRCALDKPGKDPTKKVMRIYKKNYERSICL